MSLSRRFLALPQELEGASLPPQVTGECCGVVLLCVGHILESAVSPRPLPSVSLVRVRWWGEQQPTSLFRPSLLSAAHVANEEPRAIAMKYPVRVPPEQLVAYFSDMKELSLDVIDRGSKKKFGECKVKLDVENDNSVLTAEEKLVALRREDALCEIKAVGQDNEVLGYLAVSFDVQWGEFTKEDVLERAVSAAGSSASSVSLPSKREWTNFEVEKEDSPLLENELVSTGKVEMGSKRIEVDKSRGSNDDFQRIQRLLNKGQALKQSMERAVKEKGGREEDAGENIYENGAIKQVKDALMLTSGEELTTSISSENRTSQIVSLDGKPQLYSPVPIEFNKRPTGTKYQTNTTARVNADLNFSVLNEVNALSLAFESLELERGFVENQLRQLRDSSSVSSRFSPIQICVSHSDVASVLHHNSGGTSLPLVHAFSVTTSLRKRQWHLECSSTMLLTRPPSPADDISSSEVPHPSKRDAAKRLKFHVRCENQSDAQRKKRRHEQHLYPRASKFYDLEGSVDALTLFSVAKGEEKTWATTIELFAVEGEQQTDETEPSSNTRESSRKHQMSRNKKALAVGRLHVQFSFYDASISESDSAGIEEESESLLSSITSGSDTLQGYQNRRSILPEHAELLQTMERELHSKSQYDSEGMCSRLRGSELLQFGVMFEDITNVKFLASGGGYSQSTIEESSSRKIAFEEGRSGGGGKKLDGPSLSLHYTIPSQFTTRSPTSIKFERTVRRMLKSSYWLNSTSLLQTEFSGHVHVFQSLLAEDASNYFSSGHLIVEVWMHASKEADRTLLGLSKLPLRKFTEFLRREGSGLHDFCAQSLPFIGVDGRFPIENPFNGNHAGHLRARVCIGTAEQLLTFATTIRAFVKFQGVVRGVLYRKRFGRFHTLQSFSRDPQSRPHDFDSYAIVPVMNEDTRSDTQSTAPTLNIAAISRGLSVDLDDGCTGLDADTGNQLECAPVDLKIGAAEQNKRESSLLLHKIRFDIRECWRAMLRREEQSRENENARHGWRDASLLGCELQGQIVLIGGKGRPSELKGMPFALWWDAADTKLNSCFVHAFHKRELGLDEVRVDLPLVGPQSQVLFALRVENGFFGAQSRQTISGEARLNLNTALGGGETYHESSRVEDRIVLDVPIKWDCENSEGQMLPSVLPLKISYHTSPAPLVYRNPRNGEMMDSKEEFSDDIFFVEPRRDSVASSVKLLHPASIAISFRFLALANFENLLTGNGHQNWSSDSKATRTACFLSEILSENDLCHSVLLEVTLCLGDELHEQEGTLLDHEKGVQEFGAHIFEEDGKWYKRWRSSRFPVRMSESLANFDKLSSQLAMQAHMILTPEVVTNLQEGCANVMVLLWCNTCNAPHEIGSSEVPMASVLYRAQGVRGMFPIRVGTELSAARIGVHCFVDHSLLESSRALSDEGSAANEGNSRFRDIKLLPDGGFERPPLPLMSPTSPEEITRSGMNYLNPCLKKACEVWIEQGRNIVVKEGKTEHCAYSDAVPRVYATLQVKSGELNKKSRASNWDLVKKTGVEVGACPQWNYRGIFDAGDVDWQRLTLEVSVWQSNDELRNDSSILEPSRRMKSDPHSRNEDIFVGKVQVDLSLFSRGWRDINDWYHLLNGQHQNRGQVKVHVKNIMAEETLPDKVLANTDDELSGSTSKYSINGAREIDSESIAKDEFVSPQLSLGNDVLAAYEAPEDIHTRLKSFQMSEEAISSQNHGATNESVVARDDLQQISGNEKECLKPSETGSELQEAVGDRATEAVETKPNLVNGVLAVDDRGSDDTRSENYSCASAGSQAKGIDDDNIGSDEGDSDNDSLEITTDFFKPITLASFGIDELELSPLAEGDTSLDEHMHDKTDSVAVDGLHRSCDGGLKVKGVECENVDSSSDEEDIKPVDRRAAGPEITGIDDEVESESEVLSLSSSRESHKVDLISIPSSESEDKGGDSASDVDGVQSAHDEPLRTQASLSCSRKSIEDNAIGSTTESLSVSIALDVNKLELKMSSRTNDAALGSCVGNLKPEAALDKDANEGQPESDTQYSGEQAVQYADEAVQVDSTTEPPSVNIGLDVNKLELTMSSHTNDAAHGSCVSNLKPEVSLAKNASEGQPESDTHYPGEQTVRYADKAVQVDSTTGPPSVNIGLDVNGQPESDTTYSGEQTVQYVDKAVQIDLVELEILNVIPPPTHIGQGINSKLGSAVEVIAPSCEKNSTADVGCDAMESVDIFCSSEDNSDLESKAFESSITSELEMKTEVDQEVSESTTTGSKVVITGSSYGQKDADAAPPELKIEKLELVYEMLREMRDFYFTKPLPDPVRDHNVSRNEKQQIASEKVSDARYRCSSPDRSKEFTSLSRRDFRLSVAKDPSSPLARNSPCDDDVTRMPPGDDFRKGYADNTQKVLPKLYLAERAPLDDTKSATILRRSLFNAGERKQQRDTHVTLMSSSDVWTTPQRKEVLYSAMKKEDHSSVRSLFAHDSETERIARIMQGSMNYWMKEDSNSSCDDEVSDDEDAADDDCYF